MAADRYDPKYCRMHIGFVQQKADKDINYMLVLYNPRNLVTFRAYLCAINNTQISFTETLSSSSTEIKKNYNVLPLEGNDWVAKMNGLWTSTQGCDQEILKFLAFASIADAYDGCFVDFTTKHTYTKEMEERDNSKKHAIRMIKLEERKRLREAIIAAACNALLKRQKVDGQMTC
jgi:hypothetical protein